jgi:hypothetical protein
MQSDDSPSANVSVPARTEVCRRRNKQQLGVREFGVSLCITEIFSAIQTFFTIFIFLIVLGHRETV